MAMAMAQLLSLLLLALVSISIIATSANAQQHYHPDSSKYGPGSVKINQCPGQCTRRCSQTQYQKPCLFFCNKCCRTCLCVPPGFYGNKQYCPCYNNWKTKRGGPKCP